ncbi:MAG TPA: efflux RND transporter periplasmic adaptor subunit [Anaeromyxobacteraceae bacterium]|nr:efflux RND transporter periplasmic adaptor subunit [Anaeromyxobacteraceae bacterium]
MIQRLKQHPVRWGGAAALVAALAVAAVAVSSRDTSAATEVAVSWTPVARRTLSSNVQATGLVRARTGAEVKVGARISGRVERLFSNVGDRVKKGAPIARLDDRDLRARAARAAADVAAARAQLAVVRRGARPEEISEVEAGFAQAEAEERLAAAQAGRTGGLVEKGFVGQDEGDRAQRDLAVAQAKRAAARSRLDLARRRYVDEDVLLADARVKQAEATLAEAQALVSFATLTAPIDGVIAQVSTQEGETVSAGMSAPTFVTLIDLDRLEVAAYVDEVDVGRVRVGQRATFTVDAFPGEEFAGTVTAIYPRAVIQSNVVNYITTVAIENPGGKLKPDMTANVTVSLDERRGVLAVPDRALRRERGRTVVYVASGGGAEPREVKVGLRGGGMAEIVSGLAEGERVQIQEGAKR